MRMRQAEAVVANLGIQLALNMSLREEVLVEKCLGEYSMGVSRTNYESTCTTWLAWVYSYAPKLISRECWRRRDLHLGCVAVRLLCFILAF